MNKTKAMKRTIQFIITILLAAHIIAMSGCQKEEGWHPSSWGAFHTKFVNNSDSTLWLHLETYPQHMWLYMPPGDSFTFTEDERHHAAWGNRFYMTYYTVDAIIADGIIQPDQVYQAIP